MRTSLAAVVISMACGMAHAAAPANPRPTGQNCDLSSPPPAAGEAINRGVLLRVFPRTRDIDARYTGCQVLFAPGDGRWVMLALTEVVKGDAVRIWSDQAPPEALACRYSRGKVVKGKEAECSEASNLLVKSLPAGCTEMQRKAAGGPAPKGCEME